MDGVLLCLLSVSQRFPTIQAERYTLANDGYRTIPHAIRGKLIDMLSGKRTAFWNIVNFYAKS